MNLEKFQDKIDKEIAWRKKELSTIKFDVQNSRKERNEDVKKYRIKSGIVMLYSHWEGAIKRIAQYYLNYVSGLKLPYKELRSNFLSLSLQDELSKKDNSKATKRNNLINQIFSKREEICDIGKKHKINAKGNLNSDTFKEIMATVGLATEQYESKYKLIDERLADNRNCVAHGDYFEQLSVSTIDEYVEIHEEVQKLMDNFAEDVRNAATNKKYKREKHIKVVGAAIIEDNKVLTTKRSSDRVLGDLWEFPGGKIEPGETPQQALKRELEEEFKDEILVGPQVAETVKYEYEFGIVELTVFYAKLLTNNFDLVAHSEVKWHTVDELARLNWAPADIPVAKAIEKVDLRSISFE